MNGGVQEVCGLGKVGKKEKQNGKCVAVTSHQPQFLGCLGMASRISLASCDITHASSGLMIGRLAVLAGWCVLTLDKIMATHYM